MSPRALSLDDQGLSAQAALLPFALLAFGVCLPVFVWAASHAANADWMSACFAVFAIGWAAFYGAVNWLRTPAAADIRRRGAVQLAGGLIWSLAIGCVAVFAHYAGPARETLLVLTLGAAMVCVVFTTPWLPSLLLVAPLALAGPVVALFLRPDSADLSTLGLAAAALALALALLVNRILRGQYALLAEREALLTERAEQAEAARRFARVKSDLVDSLSDELRDGLTGVAHILAAAAHGRAAPSRPQLGAALDGVNELLAIVGGPQAGTAEAPARRLRILALEPDALAAASLRACLEQLGHQVVAASHAGRAVDLARICDLDLIVCGEVEAIPALRALPGDAGRTAVVAMIGGDALDGEAALAAGADSLVRRPFA
ncbi:MAG: response regulator, partial [Phenylobacterium sp.]|nr:response regulator [Phenylobacterium sp.]